MEINQYCIKAFSNQPLMGNPAAVILLKEPLSYDWMQKIAFINGFPETVFLMHLGNDVFEISWFTPSQEVYNAGHATLSAQYVLMKYVYPKVKNIKFKWKNNLQLISRDNYKSLICTGHFSFMDQTFKDASRLFDSQLIRASYQVNSDLLIVLNNEHILMDYHPDVELIRNLPYRGVCITSESEDFDYSNRFFAPAFGVNEDYVTASAHNYLAYYWANELNKKQLKGAQLSSSMGIVNSHISEKKIILSGQCYLYSRSSIYL